MLGLNLECLSRRFTEGHEKSRVYGITSKFPEYLLNSHCTNPQATIIDQNLSSLTFVPLWLAFLHSRNPNHNLQNSTAQPYHSSS
jgi:hypothetical protein